MTPGTISKLSLSDAIAFRVRFTGPAPDREALYWRGPVLSQFDGQTWHAAPMLALNEDAPLTGGRRVDQEITLEPHNKPWLFALDLPAGAPADGLRTSEYQLFSHQPVRSRLRYSVSSIIGASPGAGEAGLWRSDALHLPEDFNPRAIALGQQLRAEFGADGQRIVNALMRHFRLQGLIYTLEPPLLGRDSVDEFLFSTRQGFCEHYASAFVFVLRAAGVPSRVVTGYQGGEWNPVDNTWIVRQSDAHAWGEFWTSTGGWKRVDPTAMSAPMRISDNLAAALPEGSPLPLIYRPELSWLRQLRFRWDAVGNGWNQWVLGYNTQKQIGLLRAWGFPTPDWRTLAATLALFSGALLLTLTVWALRTRPALDPALGAWIKLSRKMARRGLARKDWEGPLDYAQRIGQALPGKRGEILRLARLYEKARYRHDASPEAAAQLRRAVAAFHP
jgi:transglutaminase-like putative cysteine protease